MVVATVAASSLLGWLISRWKILPGTTAVWGSSPGAADRHGADGRGAFGADARLVAFMQYLRVIFVSIAAALIARFWVDDFRRRSPGNRLVSADRSGRPSPQRSASPWPAAMLGRLLRLPSPYLPRHPDPGRHPASRPRRVDSSCRHGCWRVSYAVVGWTIGLNFNRAILRHAARALPQIIGSILALIAFCGGLAFLISHVLGIDPLTAYLATSPGGLDTVAIIAAASDNVDISFVMALQTRALRSSCSCSARPSRGWSPRFGEGVTPMVPDSDHATGRSAATTAALAMSAPVLYQRIDVHAPDQSSVPFDRFRGRDLSRALLDAAASRPYRRSPGPLKERPAVDRAAPRCTSSLPVTISCMNDSIGAALRGF